MNVKSLFGYYPDSVLTPPPKRVEITIDGWDLVAIPRDEWMEILPLLTTEQWKRVYRKVYLGMDSEGESESPAPAMSPTIK